MTKLLTITPGTVYLYTAPHPSKCRGHRYRVERVLIAVPSYQEQVLVQALTGPDEGLWFVCSPWNFSTRYTPAEPPAVAEEKAAGVPVEARGSGV